MLEVNETSMAERPRIVESESATTDHESNHTGATPVVVSLVIVGVLAVLSFLLFSIIANAGATYYKARQGTNGFGYQYEYDYGFGDHYPYYSGGLEDQTW